MFEWALANLGEVIFSVIVAMILLYQLKVWFDRYLNAQLEIQKLRAQQSIEERKRQLEITEAQQIRENQAETVQSSEMLQILRELITSNKAVSEMGTINREQVGSLQQDLRQFATIIVDFVAVAKGIVESDRKVTKDISSLQKSTNKLIRLMDRIISNDQSKLERWTELNKSFAVLNSGISRVELGVQSVKDMIASRSNFAPVEARIETLAMHLQHQNELFELALGLDKESNSPLKEEIIQDKKA